MEFLKSFSRDLYSLNEGNFADIALQLFHFQSENNPVYKEYLRHLGCDARAVTALAQIPFLPISFFKKHSIKTGAWTAEVSFSSSGTTGLSPSVHPVKDLTFYLNHTVRCFEYFFGSLENYRFLCLLPSYLERKGSSLISMMTHFIKRSRSSNSGFYLNHTEELLRELKNSDDGGKKTVLWGVTFALLDLASRYQPDLGRCLVFETGGMKGRREELTRHEVHEILKSAFAVEKIYSEYGMTELFSQAYTRGENAFFCPPWMKIVVRDMTDPFRKGLLNETGGINVIDLANVDSIAFLETEDIGRAYANGSFEVLGRFDNSEVRGCNLMVE